MEELKKKLAEWDIWEYAGYEMPKAEADIVIQLLDKAIPKECKVIVVDSERADGTPCDAEICLCPGCNAKYRFSIPKYCGECGQRLKGAGE